MSDEIDFSKCTGDGLNKYSPCAMRDVIRRLEDLEALSDALKYAMSEYLKTNPVEAEG